MHWDAMSRKAWNIRTDSGRLRDEFSRDLDKNWEVVEKLPYVIGDFDWTAWDYQKTYLVSGYMGDEVAPICPAEGMLRIVGKTAYCGDVNLFGDRRPVTH